MSKSRRFPNSIEVGVDSWCIPGYLQQVMPDHEDLFAKLKDTMPWIDRDTNSMKYRGHPLNRTKFFLTKRKSRVHVYNYTGFQYQSTELYECYQDYPLVKDLVGLLEKTMPRAFKRINHVIGTYYEGASDNIGWHSDKIKSWRPTHGVAILSLGGDREFHLKDKSGNVTPFVMRHGDLFLLGWEDNKTYQHCVPKTKDELVLDTKREVQPRISICFRSIEESYTRDELRKIIARSEKAKLQRAKTKAREAAV
jgi:alkylated DNA repair dioxygenase AlkB